MEKIYFVIIDTYFDTKTRTFQYKDLHNILFANNMFFKFRKVTSLLGSFCKLHDETIMYLFYDCLIVESIWNQLNIYTIESSNKHALECHLRIL